MARGARLGQHFLTARWAAVSLARAANITPDETVLEIGPGKGMLTRELLGGGGTVIAIEKDELLVTRLQEIFAEEISRGQLKIIPDDIRNIAIETDKTALNARRGEGGFGDVPNGTVTNTLRLQNDADGVVLSVGTYVVAANIPYYITGEIIRQFLTASAQPRAMALLVQKEVAQRITSKKESILSLSVKAYGTPRIVEKVSRKCFSPAPSVDSAILLINDISRDFFTNLDETVFFAAVHAGFASKRKFLANNLAVKYGKDVATKALTAAGIDEKERAENVTLAQWKTVTQSLID